MGRTAVAWIGFWAGFAALDVVANRRGRSLCTAVRWATKSQTPMGHLALAVAYDTGSAVLRQHLLKSMAAQAHDAAA